MFNIKFYIIIIEQYYLKNPIIYLTFLNIVAAFILFYNLAINLLIL